MRDEIMLIDSKYVDLMFTFILLSSPISTISSFVLGEHIFVVILNAGVAMASSIFWFHPTYGLRRIIDMTMVGIDMIAHYSMTWYRIPVFLPNYFASHWIPYTLSWKCHHNSQALMAVMYWILLHSFVHIFNMIIYMNRR